ncbi:RYamide receptor [Carabus blaptoides fortunei]
MSPVFDYDDFGSYEYDADESQNTYQWDELIPMLIVYSVTFILGLIGNSLIVITTYRYRRMQSATNVLLASLASADLLLILFCIPIKAAKLFSFTWTMGILLCKYVYYMQTVSTICSVLTLTSISIERYYAIVHPMKAKYICTISHARRIILVTWVLSFILAVPILFAQVQMDVGVKIKAFWCVRNWCNKNVWRFQEVYMLVLVLIVPTIVMIVAYVIICYEVWRVMERRSVMTSRHALNRNYVVGSCHGSKCESIKLSDMTGTRKRVQQYKNENVLVKQVIFMLVFVVVLFIICWGPLLIDNVLTAYEILPPIRTGAIKHMGTAFHLLAYFNSCINPIIYGFMSKNFRESFQAALCCSNSDNYTTEYSPNKLTNDSIKHFSRTGSQTRNTSFT